MVHLIDKDALVAEIEKRLKANGAFDEVGDEAWAEDKGMCEAYRSILSFIDTLEVKEVGFDKEWQEYFKYRGNVATVNIKELAKHFYELGLKAQKGKEV